MAQEVLARCIRLIIRRQSDEGDDVDATALVAAMVAGSRQWQHGVGRQVENDEEDQEREMEGALWLTSFEFRRPETERSGRVFSIRVLHASHGDDFEELLDDAALLLGGLPRGSKIV